jgi:glycosyltransferase involved in cell wall biosynthesis
MTPKTVWIINPYGSLPLEAWATYRSTLLAESLVTEGYAVRQFISNFEHRSKTYRRPAADVLSISDRYDIHIVPSTSYRSHISWGRIRYERTFARNLLRAAAQLPRPDFIILAEPALFYYDILLKPLLTRDGTLLVLDVIDLWPELFELVIPGSIRRFSSIVLAPMYWWRRRLYQHAHGVVAVARDYLARATRLARRPGALFEVVYWSYDADREDPSPPSGVVPELVARKAAGELWVVYAGTLGENYDVASIIDVARRLPPQVRPRVRVKFVIAGDGPMKGLCESSASADLVFVGRLRAPELQLLYRNTDVGLCTYKGESTVAMPIKAFDWLRYGVPMVNSLGRDLGALVSTHELGVNYDPRDPEGLYAAVERMVADAGLRQVCAANARALAPQFSSRLQYPKFARLLDALAQAFATTA